jgi:hypothetical protein
LTSFVLTPTSNLSHTNRAAPPCKPPRSSPAFPRPSPARSLPPSAPASPPPVTDNPEARAARDETATAAVAALHPADAFEALLAAQIIGADAHAKDCLRLAVQPGQQPEAARSFRAQASAMMRHMQSGLRALQRTQATREKAEAAMHPVDASAPLPAPSRAQAEPPQPVVPHPSAAPHEPDRATDLMDAEQYAAIYPDCAARIRTLGGPPMPLDFGPPKPEIIEAHVTGTSPILRALDPRPNGAVAA